MSLLDHLAPYIPAIVSHARTVHLNNAAAAAWVAYDIMITWSNEVQVIWGSPPSLPKYLYFFIRYFGIFSQSLLISNTMIAFCRSWLIFQVVSSQFLMWAVEIVLVIRVQAIYDMTKTIHFSSRVFQYDIRRRALFAGDIISSVALAIVIWKPFVESLVQFPSGFPIQGCFTLHIVPFLAGYWVPTLILESILFFLMFWKGVHVFWFKGSSSFVQVFFRDGIVFYFVLFATLLANVLDWELVRSYLAGVTNQWIIAVASIAGSRLILNLRALPPVENHDPSGYSQTIQRMEFAQATVSSSLQLDGMISTCHEPCDLEVGEHDQTGSIPMHPTTHNSRLDII